jgi:hypothetical protein
MNVDAEFLTKIQEDWPHGHQLILQLFLKYANYAVREITVLPKSRNPIFETPNRTFLSGMIRYGAVDYFLDRACQMKFLPGIKPRWIKLEGIVSALVLEGKYTSLIAHHLQTPNDPPRNSILRDYRRLLNERLRLNEQNPSLFEDAKKEPEPISPSSPINLTLVHGKDFAFLRIYNRRDKPKKFIPFSIDNIMALKPMKEAASVEAEQIADAEVKLKKHLEEIKKQQAQE